MDLQALFAAVGLLLVLEGIGPFLNPGGMRKLYYLAAQMPERQLRLIGLAGMICGLLLVSWVRNG